MARNGMLECGKNYKGTMKETCDTCAVIDNENHRLNECTLWKQTNYAEKSYRANFQDIYSDDQMLLEKAIVDIENVWELQYASGKMKRTRPI